MNRARTRGLTALLLLVAFTGGLLWALPNHAGPQPTAWEAQLANEPYHRLVEMLVETLSEADSGALSTKERERRIAALDKERRSRRTSFNVTRPRHYGPCQISQYTWDRKCAER